MTKKPKKQDRRITAVRKMSSRNLCISLVSIAALHVEDKAAQLKIYEAVRRLQLLDAAATQMLEAIADDLQCPATPS